MRIEIFYAWGDICREGLRILTKKQASMTGLKELNQAISIMQGDRREVAEKILTEIVFLQDTLNKLKENVMNDGAVIMTARTTKENPAIKSYNTSIQRYSLLLKQLTDLLPAPEARQPADPVLEFIESK